MFYVLPLLVAFLNWALMRRPRASVEWDPVVGIPARNEAENLQKLLPTLVKQVSRVIVCDDASSDKTAEVARSLGAEVVVGRPLPEGWVGKNWACHQIAEHAGTADLLLLDADTQVQDNFIVQLGGLVQTSHAPVVTALPQMLPGKGVEPVYLGWVPWLLCALNPFGLVARTQKGHNMMLNGQLVAWTRGTYAAVLPHEKCKSEVLEDIKIGRLLARIKIPVEVIDLSGCFAVKMYPDFRSAWQGMSKNSCFVGWPPMMALLCLLWAWLWLAGFWPGYLMLVLSKALVDRLTRMPWWTAPLMPITLTLAAATFVWSYYLQLTGRLTWKGRKV